MTESEIFCENSSGGIIKPDQIVLTDKDNNLLDKSLFSVVNLDNNSSKVSILIDTEADWLKIAVIGKNDSDPNINGEILQSIEISDLEVGKNITTVKEEVTLENPNDKEEPDASAK